jgi:hypothetical protein
MPIVSPAAAKSLRPSGVGARLHDMSQRNWCNPER